MKNSKVSNEQMLQVIDKFEEKHSGLPMSEAVSESYEKLDLKEKKRIEEIWQGDYLKNLESASKRDRRMLLGLLISKSDNASSEEESLYNAELQKLLDAMSAIT